MRVIAVMEFTPDEIRAAVARVKANKSAMWEVESVSVCGTYRETMYADTEQQARDLADACEADGCWTCTITPPSSR